MSALVTDETIKQVEDLAVLAPLHNGPEAKGAEVMRELLPDAVVFVLVVAVDRLADFLNETRGNTFAGFKVDKLDRRSS